MKTICVVVPCYNEEDSVELLYERIDTVVKGNLSEYDYHIIYVDDYSKDNTRKKIRELCAKDPGHVRAAFNSANFGFSRNVFSSLQLADGDINFMLFGDLQDPPEILPKLVAEHEKTGKSVIIGQKTGSAESKRMSFMRKMYYGMIDLFSDKHQIKNFNGFGLYDSNFIQTIRQVEDLQPYLKQIVAEYCPDYGVVGYQQSVSNRGKSNFNFYRNYDFAMEGITSSTKKLMRLSTLIGTILGAFSGIYAISVVIKKLIYWDSYPFGMAALTVGVFFIGAVQLFFIGILGEYLLSVNTKTLRRPRTVIGEKINFGE